MARRTEADRTNNLLTVGEVVDELFKLPRTMKLWVGVPNSNGGFSPCLCVSHISADPHGDPVKDDCGIVLDPNTAYSNRTYTGE